MKANMIQTLGVTLLALALVNCGRASMVDNGDLAQTQTQSATLSGQTNSGTANSEPQVMPVSALSPRETDEKPTCEQVAARVAEIDQHLALYAASEYAETVLAKAIIFAAVSPVDYISVHVSPGIAQGPNIPDQLDGITIKRRDLYFGYDTTSDIRYSLTNSAPYTLPSVLVGIQSVQDAMVAYRKSIAALPKYAGPSGMRLIARYYNYQQRPMGYLDAWKIGEEKAALQAASCI